MRYTYFKNGDVPKFSRHPHTKKNTTHSPPYYNYYSPLYNST